MNLASTNKKILLAFEALATWVEDLDLSIRDFVGAVLALVAFAVMYVVYGHFAYWAAMVIGVTGGTFIGKTARSERASLAVGGAVCLPLMVIAIAIVLIFP